MHVSKASMGLLKKQKAQRGIAAAQSYTALLVEPFFFKSWGRAFGGKALLLKEKTCQERQRS